MMELNETKLNELLGKVVTEMGAAANGSLIILGDKLGLYKSLALQGPITSKQLSENTQTTERYVREWLSAQAASGYIEYDYTNEKFWMTPEQATVFGDVESPVFMTGGFYAVSSMYHDEPKIEQAFKSGEGVSWGDHDGCLFCGTEKFFKPTYKSNLVANWIPALDGVEEKLKKGAKVADIGCGHGVSTIVMAQTFPKSEFIGFDFHKESIARAIALATDAGVNNVSFKVATAKTFPGNNYDFVTFFDCLHDMGDPVGACSHVVNALKSDGTCMIVEPFANDTLQENLNPIGRAMYAFSTMICTPSSISQEVGLGLGAQAGEKRLKQVAVSGGFRSFRRATETPFNLILEARP
jgi:SAM-dependent methyltransferase